MEANATTTGLPPYPMEELTRIRKKLLSEGRRVYDFGTGDPKIPTWEPIRRALREAVPEISQYPSIKGDDRLVQAQRGYLTRTFGIEADDFDILPTSGSKEAVFHVALSIVGRAGGRRGIVYPDPGYPVYRSSALFAGGVPYPVRLSPDSGYLLEPWKLPRDIQQDAAAMWINYPHNPTGAICSRAYLEKVVDWCQQNNTLLLADDCYVDIYHPKISHEHRPATPLEISRDGVLCFYSLSKRSGLTGYRSGFMAGDREFMRAHVHARSNFGLGGPGFVQAAAIVAWNDDEHVAERRRIFADRIDVAVPPLRDLGMLDRGPEATFYLWCKVPKSFAGNDIQFALKLAEAGVLATPSTWLSEDMKGFIRFALVPGFDETREAFNIVKEVTERG